MLHIVHLRRTGRPKYGWTNRAIHASNHCDSRLQGVTQDQKYSFRGRVNGDRATTYLSQRQSRAMRLTLLMMTATSVKFKES